jgi:2-polyprenyl-6-methoxyphenol hydroxylase-like FAD-dependent oxidoreductase
MRLRGMGCMGKSFDIAVIGAGVGGLAAATTLRRAGHRVTVYERFAASRPIGSGLMLQPTGLAALERLGLRNRIEARGARIDKLHGLNERGGVVFDLSYADLDPAFYAVGVHRAALHAVLWEAFVRSGAAIETDWTIVDVATAGGGRARLSDDRARISPGFDLVVDASGARSCLRPRVTHAAPREFAYGAVWASVPDLGIAPATLAQRYVAARIMIGHLPVGRISEESAPLAAFFWSLKPVDYPAWRTGFDDWRRQVPRLWPAMEPVIANLDNPDDLALASYMHFTARRPFRGPLALLGDAAHATSPQLGQGANSALLDALALGDALDGTGDIAHALAVYARLRRRHVRFYQFASAAMTPFFQSDSRLLAKARDVAFHRLKIIPYLRREMLRTLAGLKTGLLASDTAEGLAGAQASTSNTPVDAALPMG